MHKSLLFLIATFTIILSPVYASGLVLTGPSCTVLAKVVAKGADVTKSADGNMGGYATDFVKLQIIEVKDLEQTTGCSFITIGNIYKIEGGSNPNLLKIDDVIESGVELNSSMTPSGTAPFIQWQPIELINSDRVLPEQFFLQSDNIFENVEQKPAEANSHNIYEPILLTVFLLLGGLVYFFLKLKARLSAK